MRYRKHNMQDSVRLHLIKSTSMNSLLTNGKFGIITAKMTFKTQGHESAQTQRLYLHAACTRDCFQVEIQK